jgi:hypothetical protein
MNEKQELENVLAQVKKETVRIVNIEDTDGFSEAVQEIFNNITTELEISFHLGWDDGYGTDLNLDYDCFDEENEEILNEIEAEMRSKIDENYYYLVYCAQCSDIENASVVKLSEMIRNSYKNNTSYCRYCNGVNRGWGNITHVYITTENFDKHKDIIERSSREIFDEITSIYEH